MADPVAIADTVRTKALQDAATVLRHECGVIRSKQRKERTRERERQHDLLMRLAKRIEALDVKP
jgi:hypothetical protein